MKKLFFLFSVVVFLSNFLAVQAQEILPVTFAGENTPHSFELKFSEPYFKGNANQSERSSQIKNIQNFDDVSGIAYTSDALFRTDTNGETWREIVLPRSSNEKIGAVNFENDLNGTAILSDSKNARVFLAQTSDGGNSWTKTRINLREQDALEADLENISLGIYNDGDLILFLRTPTNSNFNGQIIYEYSNTEQIWSFTQRTVEIRRDNDVANDKISENWTLKTDGNCEGRKVGCVQESKIIANGKEITPPQIKELIEIEKNKAELEARNFVFAQPPGGATRISLNRGFDKCTAAPASQMQTWWDNSPFYDVNIYMSGRNRGCSQAQLTAAWVNQVSAMGWGLIPTIVGYQSPCSVCTSCQKHSSDNAVAETQGRGEADIAITDANNLGLLQGTVLYYDMERYDETTATPNCRASTSAFLKGWTDRVKEQGYISGVYGSPFNANADWINIPIASRMDAVWLARWNNIMSVFGVAPLPDNFWANHQRIHQWLGPRNETWGGVTFNIDNNISDAPVAGVRVPKNKPADFDGDGKTDVSVFRPDTGTWYILNSSNSTFRGITFGTATDIIAPADYDGDGKTDTAIFRPSEGNWYILTKAGTFSSRNFGTNGDIPVAADYNGDGKADLAVFRPSNGTWYILGSDSLATLTIFQFGANGDKPVSSDYDGDGKTDIAVRRDSTGDWFVLRSADNSFFGLNFGQTGDKSAQGDFDGDNKTDFAVYRNGVWYLQQSTHGFSSVTFGTNGDLPVTGDFDGDNKSDVAVFRPSNGTWYLLQSTSGFTAYTFGNSTDKPIPIVYLGQ